MYGLCVWFVPERGKMPHAPPKEVPNGRFLGTCSPIDAPWWSQFDIDENDTNCVNYKYCLVDVTGFSQSCID